MLELIVGTALLGLLAAMFVWFLIPTMRIANLGTTRVDIQQMAVLACNRLAADLQDSSGEAISLHSGAAADPLSQPVVVAMIAIKDVDSQGRRVWEPQVTAYAWDRGSQRLLRRTYPPGSGLSVPLPVDRPTRFAAADLLLLAEPTPSSTQLASRVVDFDTTEIVTRRAYAITIAIEEGVSGKHKAERFDYKKIVSLRN